MRPVPTAGLDRDLVSFLGEIRSAVSQLQQPGKPAQAYATVFASLPAASDYKNCCVMVTDKNALAVSTSVAGTWTWLRADGSAL